MKELLQQYIDNGLADFEGLQITGYIPVKQELLNSLIADALKPKPVTPDAPQPEAAAEAVPAPAPLKPKKSSGMDSKALVELVKGMVHRAEVRAENGVLAIEFEIRR